MNKRVFSILLCLCMVLSLLPTMALAADAPTNGSGTQADPYRIGTAKELISFAAWYNSLDFGGQSLTNIAVGEVYVKLTDDIDLNPGFVFTKDGYTGDGTPVEWTPIGNSVTAPHGFFGVFDGDGHSISGVYINEKSSTGSYGATGLFRYVDNYNLTGTVKNLKVKNSYIGSMSHATGSIVGVNGGTVDNCESNAFVHVNASTGSFGGIGGIVGNNNNYWAITTNCTFTGSVVADNASGTPYVGGIAGHNYKGYVGGCTNSGTVTAAVDKVGGIVGANIPLNTGSNNDKTYGQANDGKVEGCVNTGAVIGTDSVGGIVGYSEAWGAAHLNGSILNCTNRGTVTATANNGAAGGVVGYCNHTDVKGCSNYANVSTGSATNLGGMVGKFYGASIDNCWYSQTSTVNNGLNLVGWSNTGVSEPTNSGVLSTPSSPTDVGAVVGDAQIALSWTAPSSTGGSAIAGYKVACSTTDTAPTSAGDWKATNSASTEYTVTGLENGTTYYFWVKAVNEVGDSEASTSVSATPMGTTMNVATAEQMTKALGYETVTTINITGSFSYDGAISKAVAINVKSGSTLTLNYITDNSKVSTVCNADITVEDGGVVCFNQQYTMNTSYLVMNGDFVLGSGATATTTSAAFAGNILFQGAFTNNGSFDAKNGNAFLKYGTASGTFTNGASCYNLCIKTPTKTSVSDAKLYITDVTGTVAIGEKLHPVLDGFGEITETIPGLGITWGDMGNGGATFEYTVPASKAGSAINVKVNGSPSDSHYAYFLVNGTTVTKVTTPDSTGYTTAKVAQLDTVYVGGASASDSNTGASADKALASITTAFSAAADNGKIVLCGNVSTTANGWLATKGSVTITNTDGANTYSDATLTLNGAQFPSGNITFQNIKLLKGAAAQSGALVPTANNTNLIFDTVTAKDASGNLVSFNIQNAYGCTEVAATVKGCEMQLSVSAGSNAVTLTLDNATVVSYFGNTTLIGDVSLTNGSTLITPQIINNLTSDNSENALALFENDGVPAAVTVNGTVTIAEGKPITLLNYIDDAYKAFTAGNLTLLTSSAANDSLTAEKFITKDTVNYSLKKVDNSIVTEKKIVVTFNANGGTCDTTAMGVDENGKLASLPTPTRSGSYTFDGWYTLETGGTKITTDDVFADSTTVYAHWNYTGGSSDGGSTAPSVTVPVSSDEGSVSVSASVSGSTATITVTDKQLAEIASNTASTGTVTVDLSALENVNSAKIPANIITASNTATGSEGLEIILPTGTVKLDKTALSSIAYSNEDITVFVETVKTSTLTNAQKEALGDMIDTAVVMDINILLNGSKVTSFNGGKLTVSFPYTPKNGEDTSKLTVWYVKDDGTIEKMGGHYDSANKLFVFETIHLSKYVLVSDTRVNPFIDISADAYYYDAVLWAVSKGVTSGTSATTFAPNDICTRAQAVTFLWRAMGSPEPTATVNPFTDVNSGAYYYKAVLWAVEKGITVGTSATTFSPDATVSRAQAATFLWRAAGEPVATTESTFTDVPTDAYYAAAVLWAAEKGITSGTTATTFAPANDCTRGQIITFLYRYLVK